MPVHPRAAAAALALALAAAACVASAGAPKGPPPTADDEPDGGVSAGDIHTVSGKVAAIRWPELEVVLDLADGPLTLKVDRDTVVYLENRLGTLHNLTVGLPVRASYGPAKRAFWIEVRPRGVVPTAAGDAGVGTDAGPPEIPAPPAADGGAAAASSDGGAGGSPPPPPPGGAQPGGPPPPPTDAPIPPARPEPPSPSGPGPVPSP